MYIVTIQSFLDLVQISSIYVSNLSVFFLTRILQVLLFADIACIFILDHVPKLLFTEIEFGMSVAQ